MARIALKIDVDTLRGTEQGVPNLARMLNSVQASATFLFSLGPDHTGRAIKRAFRPGFLKKVSRTSVVEHYGIRTLLYGTLLPGPDIGKRCAAGMRAIDRAGFETGIHCWDHVLWQDSVRQKGPDWTQRQMAMSYERFVDTFAHAPATHGAAGWQMNDDAFAQLDAWGMRYASDGRCFRGDTAYHPIVRGQTLSHVQLPTTLPTLDELIGFNGLDNSSVAEYLLQSTANCDQAQVFTLHAELEGQRAAPVFKKLLFGWRAQGHELVSLGALFASLGQTPLPSKPVQWGPVPGRSGDLVIHIPVAIPAVFD